MPGELPLGRGINRVAVKRSVQPAFATKLFKMNSPMGLRQMLPWQMKSTRIIRYPSVVMFRTGLW